ncbi:MAG: hypothetical protein U9N42_02760 [Campylobacterota bacterium]|nr:hypothetical protein [Campylobacterota bacterium]
MVKKILLGLATASLLFSAEALACSKKNGMNKHMSSKYMQGREARNVINAVSKTGLSAAQTLKIAEGVADYKATMKQIKQMKIFPVDSFINDNFDENKFIGEMSKKYQAKIAAQAALFKYVFTVLDDEQRKIFKREYAAPVIKKMIKMNLHGSMGKGQMSNGNTIPPKPCKMKNM